MLHSLIQLISPHQMLATDCGLTEMLSELEVVELGMVMKAELEEVMLEVVMIVELEVVMIVELEVVMIIELEVVILWELEMVELDMAMMQLCCYTL